MDRNSLGRRRLDNDREVAQACLFRHFKSLSTTYRCFGWNQLPDEFRVSPSTANRRFREWSTDGRWEKFWQAFLAIRNPANQRRRRKLQETLESRPINRRFPIGSLLAELERAYVFFNDHFFGSSLPEKIALSIEHQSLRLCRGYFCANLWQNGPREIGHIALHASVFRGRAAEALAVLLHEMVHLRNSQIGLRDCHSRNQYHNRFFRDIAALAGLTCDTRHPVVGYAITRLNKTGRNAITELRPKSSVFRWKLN